MALNVKVGLIGKLDMLKFKNMPKVREKAIQAAPAKEITGEFAMNTKAKHLHPDTLSLVISEIIDHPEAQSKTYVLKSEDGEALPYFRAGQYLSLKLAFDKSFVTRAYSISSSPLDALRGSYSITVRSNPSGFAAEKILSEWKTGDTVISSSPLGQFYYEEIRDEKAVIALAGGSGITPFLSMAYAIRDGIEDFNLTILYGSRTEDVILFRDELEKIAVECPKVKVVHILSDEEKNGYEHGFINAEIIRKYAPEDGKYSVFLCGPEAMYRFVKPEIGKLGLPGRLFRRKMIDVTKKPWDEKGYPAEARGKTFSITVKQGPVEYRISASADETVLTALERAGIKAPSRCHSGECGWCRSRLLAGSVFLPESNEGRRWADGEYGYIHPCASFPVSDLTLEVPGEYY